MNNPVIRDINGNPVDPALLQAKASVMTEAATHGRVKQILRHDATQQRIMKAWACKSACRVNARSLFVSVQKSDRDFIVPSTGKYVRWMSLPGTSIERKAFEIVAKRIRDTVNGAPNSSNESLQSRRVARDESANALDTQIRLAPAPVALPTEEPVPEGPSFGNFAFNQNNHVLDGPSDNAESNQIEGVYDPAFIAQTQWQNSSATLNPDPTFLRALPAALDHAFNEYHAENNKSEHVYTPAPFNDAPIKTSSDFHPLNQLNPFQIPPDSAPYAYNGSEYSPSSTIVGHFLDTSRPGTSTGTLLPTPSPDPHALHYTGTRPNVQWQSNMSGFYPSNSSSGIPNYYAAPQLDGGYLQSGPVNPLEWTQRSMENMLHQPKPVYHYRASNFISEAEKEALTLFCYPEQYAFTADESG